MGKYVVYVAGPFRAENAWEIEQNIRRAEALALEVWKLGLAAVCPHANNRFYQGAASDDVWLAGDLAILERCDALLLVPDWQDSEGTLEEIDHAREQGIPVFSNLADLQAWVADGEPMQAAGVFGALKDAVEHDEFHITVATTRPTAYRLAKSFDAWALLHDLFRDLRLGAREKGMVHTEYLSRLDLNSGILDDLADALYREMEDRGLDIDSAFEG